MSSYVNRKKRKSGTELNPVPCRLTVKGNGEICLTYKEKLFQVQHIRINYEKFQVLTTMRLKTVVFLDVAQCNLVEIADVSGVLTASRH